MAPGDADFDSGMSSETSKAETPEKILAIEPSEDEDDEDETLAERLWGLTEMFPDTVRSVTSTLVNGIIGGIKSSYSLTCHGAWILSTTSLILYAPVLFEVERFNAQEAMRKDQQQVLLGPSGGGQR